jgi:hypothetical protein
MTASIFFIGSTELVDMRAGNRAARKEPASIILLAWNVPDGPRRSILAVVRAKGLCAPVFCAKIAHIVGNAGLCGQGGTASPAETHDEQIAETTPTGGRSGRTDRDAASLDADQALREKWAALRRA